MAGSNSSSTNVLGIEVSSVLKRHVDKGKLSSFEAQLELNRMLDLASFRLRQTSTPLCTQGIAEALGTKNERSCSNDVDQSGIDTATSDNGSHPKLEESLSDSGEVNTQKVSRLAQEASELLPDTKLVASRNRNKIQASEPRTQLLTDQSTYQEADLKYGPATANAEFSSSLPRIGLNGNPSDFQPLEQQKASCQDAFHTLPMEPPPGFAAPAGLTPPPGFSAPPFPSPPGLIENVQPTADMDHVECYGASPVGLPGQEMLGHSIAATWTATLPPGTVRHSVGHVKPIPPICPSETSMRSPNKIHTCPMSLKRVRDKQYQEFLKDVRALRAADLERSHARGAATATVDAKSSGAGGAALPKTGQQNSSRKVVNKRVPAEFAL